MNKVTSFDTLREIARNFPESLNSQENDRCDILTRALSATLSPHAEMRSEVRCNTITRSLHNADTLVAQKRPN